ncbi:hypothetical protein MKJ04_13635 [Pontibacter sp. E15-1]|uniref:DUF7793 family protein n=1 Tax=Pontibacter sp. E15-1 TaxID=2919918 RepID=UPI001F4FFDD8|nr:hypothetical protein [Pontibacter sp. E15-1]MCJ8165888.1 hypothetical protein [Pontibacter sp. E15-1]
MKKIYNKAENRSFESAYIKMSIIDGILHFTYKQIENMDLDLAKTCVADRLRFTGDASYPCLVDVIMLKSSSKEARDYFATAGNQGIIANAILVNSSAFKMMANFYIMVNKPVNTTRMFTDKQSALEWLQQFKD